MSNNSITLAAARRIFGDRLTIEPIEFAGKTVGYRAIWGGWALEEVSLTKLCAMVVNKLVPDATPSGTPCPGFKPWPND